MVDPMPDEDIRAMLAGLESERDRYRLPSLTHEEALRIGSAALEIADADDLGVVVRVTRGRQIAFHFARAGTTAEIDDWARRKGNAAAFFETPTLETALRFQLGRRSQAWLDPHEFALAGGGIPLIVGGAVAGTIAVSGLVGSIREDHDFAIRALRAAAGH